MSAGMAGFWLSAIDDIGTSQIIVVENRETQIDAEFSNEFPRRPQREVYQHYDIACL